MRPLVVAEACLPLYGMQSVISNILVATAAKPVAAAVGRVCLCCAGRVGIATASAPDCHAGHCSLRHQPIQTS